jgi:hypothetical protein
MPTRPARAVAGADRAIGSPPHAPDGDDVPHAGPVAPVVARVVEVPAPAPAPASRAAAPTVPAAPGDDVVRVTIGRVEVRVVPTAPSPPAPPPLARPRRSLDDHLAARDRRPR